MLQRAIATRPGRVGDLASRFGVSRRTVFRDLKSLREAGVSVRYDAAEETYVANEAEPWLLNIDGITTLLYQAATSLFPAEPEHADLASQTARLLASHLPAGTRARWEAFRNATEVVQLEVGRSATHFETIREAVEKRACIEVDCPRLLGRETEWHPLQIYQFSYDLNTGWCVCGVLTNTHTTARIALSQISGVRLSGPAASNLKLEELIGRGIDHDIR